MTILQQVLNVLDDEVDGHYNQSKRPQLHTQSPINTQNAPDSHCIQQCKFSLTEFNTIYEVQVSNYFISCVGMPQLLDSVHLGTQSIVIVAVSGMQLRIA